MLDVQTTPATRDLPENAYRELAPGEVYRPMVAPGESVPEVTARSVLFGLAMTAMFSLAVAYVGLRLGQGIESAIPIAILAIGFSALPMLKRRSTILENVNVVTIGATAGIVVGGSVFVMPAVYILDLQGQSGFLQIFLVPLLGAVLGAMFLIPFRRYFVADMHGKLPFPEATATTEILVAGDRGGNQARVLLYSMGIGIVLDFLALNLRLWRDTFTTATIEVLKPVTEGVKGVFLLNTSAAVLGLGYIIGVHYAAVICAGSFLSYWVLVPLFGRIGALTSGPIFAGRPPLAGLGWEGLFFEHVRYIGIGAIFTAGVLSILKMSPVIVQAVRQVLAEMKRLGRRGQRETTMPRTDLDLTMGRVATATFALSVVIFVYFRFVVLATSDPAIDSAVHTTPPISSTESIPGLPATPRRDITMAPMISVVSVMPETGVMLMVAIAHADTAAKRNDTTSVSARAATDSDAAWSLAPSTAKRK